MSIFKNLFFFKTHLEACVITRGTTITTWQKVNQSLKSQDTPYLALTGELSWGFYCEDLWENLPNFNNTALQFDISFTVY